ncbi:hypothetical protein ACFQ07_23240 [Actinomadura adrarensis]|uniref:Uncharacterized protein n=1 Tax=Actinomadura adrarensis TaxID=1819600 RepID=A0ABW3CLA0_9ACTN
MSALYEGRAVLLDDAGREIEVEARLWVFHEPHYENFGGPFLELLPGTLSWGGLLEAEAPIAGRFVLPFRVRMPDGQERELLTVSGDSATPLRVEVEGKGDAPWDWQADWQAS